MNRHFIRVHDISQTELTLLIPAISEALLFRVPLRTLPWTPRVGDSFYAQVLPDRDGQPQLSEFEPPLPL